ncbi:hypothetical protein DFR69_114169 [Nocardia neocaledoniensis]|uniref:Nucleotidyltransferase-like protein n=2 Tax=Nocardia neocaledoniensis TaxID=236511 RepID=A0A317N553_9NOCA|nr:hypothetical protein [Nocardia neocaledoniensis]PWV70202.1 hypothetical protein DFR69_114169 [Nocardia neocaledoniensis]
MTPELFAAAAEVCRKFAPPRGYGLVYGSQAVNGESRSDLDLVIVGRSRPGYHHMADLVAAVCELHADFGLLQDTEVDYETKLFATHADVCCAVELRCFPRSQGVLSPGVVVAEADWLNSSEFAQRLVLNALTSEHIFLGGDVRRYRADRSRAERAVATLALAMVAKPEVTIHDAVEVLTRSADGARGKDFLGYQPTAHLYSTIQSGFAALVAGNVVEIVGGSRFRRCREPRGVVGPVQAA